MKKIVLLASLTFCSALPISLRQAINSRDLSKVTTALRQVAPVNETDKKGQTALMQAAKIGFCDAITPLIEYGADVNQQDNYKTTALLFASAEGYLDCVKLLILHGANPYLPTDEGFTPLSSAQYERHQKVVDYLNDLEEDVTAFAAQPFFFTAKTNLPDYIFFNLALFQLLDGDDNNFNTLMQFFEKSPTTDSRDIKQLFEQALQLHRYNKKNYQAIDQVYRGYKLSRKDHGGLFGKFK